MQWFTPVILGIGCVVTWPIAKDQAINQMVNKFAQQTQINSALKSNDIGGPLGTTIAFTMMKGIAEQMMAQQDLGTQIELVIQVLVTGQIPAIPNL